MQKLFFIATIFLLELSRHMVVFSSYKQLLNGIYKFCDFMISQIFEVMKLTLCSFKNLVNKNLFSAMLVRIFCENVFDYI